MVFRVTVRESVWVCVGDVFSPRFSDNAFNILRPRVKRRLMFVVKREPFLIKSEYTLAFSKITFC